MCVCVWICIRFMISCHACVCLCQRLGHPRFQISFKLSCTHLLTSLSPHPPPALHKLPPSLPAHGARFVYEQLSQHTSETVWMTSVWAHPTFFNHRCFSLMFFFVFKRYFKIVCSLYVTQTPEVSLRLFDFVSLL